MSVVEQYRVHTAKQIRLLRDEQDALVGCSKAVREYINCIPSDHTAIALAELLVIRLDAMTALHKANASIIRLLSKLP